MTSVRLYDDNALIGDKSGVLIGTGIADKSKDDIVTLTKPNGDSSNYSYTWTDKVVVAQFNDKNNKNEFNSSKMSSIKQDNNDMYIAVLDEGVITGICTVYVEGAGESSDTVSKGGVTATASVSGTGTVSVVFDVDRPEYVPAGESGSITADLYINGVYETQITQPLTSGQDKVRWTYGTKVDSEDTASVDKDSIKVTYDNVKVQYVDKSNGGYVVMDSTAPTTIAVGSGKSLSAAISTSAYTDASYATVTGTSGVAGTISNSTGTISGSDLTVAGDGYVVIEITGLAKDTTVDFDFTAINKALSTWDVNSASDKDLSLTFGVKTGSATGITPGTPKTLTVKLASGTVSDAYNYYVELDGAGKVLLNGTTAVDFPNAVTINSDITYTVADVKVTPVPKLAIVAASWTDYGITVKFNRAVTSKTPASGFVTSDDYTYTNTSSNGSAVDKVSAVGSDTITFTFKDAALTAGDKLAFTVEIKDAEVSGNALTAVTLTLKADGVLNNGGVDLPKA